MLAEMRVLTAIALLCLAVPVASAEEPPIRGQVVSAGEPVAGVKVSLTPMIGNYGLGERFLGLAPFLDSVSEAETDPDGRFVVFAPEVGFWSLSLAAPGLAPVERVLLSVVEQTQLGRLALEPAEELEVVVTDEERNPVAARVSIFRTSSALRGEDFKSLGRRWRVASTLVPGSPWRLLPTDAQGRLVVEVAAEERLLVRAVSPGLAAAEAITRGGGTIRLKLARGVGRRLRVVNVRGSGLPGVMVFDERAEVPLVATGEDGRAVLTWEGTKPLRVVLLDGGGRRGTARIEVPRVDASPAEVEEVTVTLDEPAIVAGRVIDRFTREPVVDALVWSDDLENRTHTGPTGRYELHRLGRRSRITALKTGYVRGQTRSEDASGTAPTLSLHPTITLSGRVVDRLGDPLGDVDIHVWRDLGRPDASLRYSGWGAGSVRERSAADGTFEVAGLPARMAFQLSASREGWAERRLEIDPLEPFAQRDGIHLVLGPGRRAAGRVVDESNEPIDGVAVTLLPRDEDESGPRDPGNGDHGRQLVARTDSDGGFVVVDAAFGLHDLDLEADGYAPERVLGVEIADSDKETELGVFRLRPGAIVEGRVVDLDAEPVAGAEIKVSNDPALRATQARQALAREPVDAISDGQGRFAVGSQRPGSQVTLVVDSEDHVPEVVSGLTAPSPTPVEIVLRPPSGVSGRVVDPEGRGVPQAQLVLVPEGRAGSGGFGGPPHYAESRDDGSFEIRRVPAGPITLVSTAGGLQDLRTSGLEVPQGRELSGIELVMRAGATIEGVVLDPDGDPVVNALVFLLNSRWGRKGDLTDGDGRYRIDGLVSASISLAADHRDFPRVARDLEIDLGTNVVDLVFGGGAAVSGQVRDEFGQPVSGAWVRLVRAIRTRHSPTTVTGEDGSFLFPGVARGDYWVDAGRRGFAEHRREPAIPVQDQPITGVDIELQRGATVRGEILGLPESEVARVEVTAYGDLGTHRGRVGPNWRYEVDHLAPGDWTVRAEVRTSGRAVLDRLTVEPDDDDVSLDLDFAAGFTLTGTVTHGGFALQGATVGARGLSVGYAGNTTTDADGSFRFEALEEGRYWVGLYDFASGLRHSEEVEIDGDSELSIELITDKVSGVVANAFDREPVADARVVLEALLEDQEIAARLLQPGGISDSSGYFSLGEVSHGLYDLVVSRTGYSESRTPLDISGPEEDMELELTPTEGIFFELSVAAAGPVDWATAVVLDGDQPVARGSWAASDKGRLRVTGVPPGRYEMLIWAPGGATQSLSVLSPGDLGAVTLARGGTADVVVPELADDGTVAEARLVGADGRGYRAVFGAQVTEEFPLREGRTRILGVPAGTWSVQVDTADGRSWVAGTTITADQITVVNVE
jgi:protocatechuate 3,4-dioxygenase beta subunit